MKHMTDKNDQPPEFPSYHEVQELMYQVLGLLASNFSGETTINSLRIGNYIGLKSIYRLEPTNNKDISRSLKIAPSTVTRIVTHLIDRGYVIESSHPDDGRIKLIAIVDAHPLQTGFESELRKVVRDFLLSYDSSRTE